MKLVYLASHPIQYHAPLFRALSAHCDFEVWFAHRQDAAGQAAAGYGRDFDWDVDLLSGYPQVFLHNIARRPSVASFGGCDTPEIAARLAARRPDALLVGGWNLKAYWQAILAARRLDIPVFARSDSQRVPDDGWSRRVLRQLLHRPALRALDGFVAAGQRSREYLLALGVPASRIAIVPHTIDVQRFGGAISQRQATRAAFDAGPRPAVLFVGRLIGLKRVDLLLAALADMRSMDAVAWIAGDGPMRAALEQQAAQLGVDARFLGFRNQSELPAIYAAADLLVLPSERDTWGLVVNEALAAGCAALVSPSAGCGPDFLPFAPAFRVFEPATVDGLRAAMLAMLDQPDAAAVARACAAATASFAPDLVSRNLLAVLSTMTGRDR